jgi:hypothetical protein
MKSTHSSAAVRNYEDKDMTKMPLKMWIVFSNEFDHFLVQTGDWSEVSKMMDEVCPI